MTLFHKIYLYLKMILIQINWSPSETLLEIGGFSIYVYSLMFILAFLVGYNLVKSFFLKEKVDEKYLDPMLIYMVISVFLGARFGEVFFYQWGYYQNHLTSSRSTRARRTRRSSRRRGPSPTGRRSRRRSAGETAGTRRISL